jgi:hypothetical protein
MPAETRGTRGRRAGRVAVSGTREAEHFHSSVHRVHPHSAAYAAGVNEYTDMGVGSLDMVNVTMANHEVE